MPKLGNRVPQARLHRPSGQARVRIDGRDIYLGKFGSADARKRYAEVLADFTARRAAGASMSPAAPVTVSVAVFRFWQWADVHYRHPDGTPTRAADGFKESLRPLRQMFGELPLAELGPSKVYEYQASLAARGLARTTVNARVQKVRRFVRWCIGRELAPATLAPALASVEPVRAGKGAREAPRRRPVEWERVEKTLPHLPPMLQALVLTLWYSGARVGEIVTLTTGCIDRGGEIWRADLDRHKTVGHGHDHLLLFGPEAQKALEPWLRPEAPEAPIFAPRRVNPRTAKWHGKLEPGEHYARPSLPQAIRRACVAAFPHPHVAEILVRRKALKARAEKQALDAELAEWKRANREKLDAWERAHRWQLAQLRHARATTLREQFGLDVAQTVLGHSRPSTTTIYSRTALAHAEAALKLVG